MHLVAAHRALLADQPTDRAGLQLAVGGAAVAVLKVAVVALFESALITPSPHTVQTPPAGADPARLDREAAGHAAVAGDVVAVVAGLVRADHAVAAELALWPAAEAVVVGRRCS